MNSERLGDKGIHARLQHGRGGLVVHVGRYVDDLLRRELLIQFPRPSREASASVWPPDRPSHTFASLQQIVTTYCI